MTMHRQILASLFSGAIASAIAIPMLSNLVDAQTPINQLQQRPPSTTVSGKVVRAVGNDFILEDSTGQVIVDAGPRWWQEIDLQPGEQIKVTGELGRSGELDAFAIVRTDGSVINIRPTEGPPPWAGGPKDKRPKPK
jgi:RNase P/RNase MRP subunit p29